MQFQDLRGLCSHGDVFYDNSGRIESAIVILPLAPIAFSAEWLLCFEKKTKNTEREGESERERAGKQIKLKEEKDETQNQKRKGAHEEKVSTMENLQ